MTDLKISELEDGGSSQAADAIPIARSGQNYYVTSQYLKNFVFGSNGTISIVAGKTFSVNNTITLNGNDGVSVNFGSGGTFLYSGGALGIPSSGTMTNVTGLPLTSGVTGTLGVSNGGTGITSFGTGVAAALGQNTTGSGGIVLATGPTLTTPVLGVASATSINKIALSQPASGATLTLADGSTLATSGAYNITLTATGPTSLTLPTSGSITTTASKLSVFAATSSSELASVISDETGTGSLVFSNSPTLVTPNLGTPSAITLTSATGLPLATGVTGTLAVANGGTGITSFGTGIATWLGTPSSANLAAAITDETGSGSLVFGTTPSITSPTITGTATFNGSASGSVSLRAPAVAGTTSFQLPANNGTSGYVLVTDGLGNTSWAAAGGAAGNAAGVNKNIQFNDATAMAGAGSFNFDKTTNTVTLGVVSSTTGTFALANSGSAYTASIKSGVNSADWTLTLPTSAGTNNYLLKTDGSGNTAWVNPTALGIDLDVGTTAITGGVSGRVLYDNAGALGELATTGSGSVVLATSPTLVTPALGTPTSGNFSTGTFTWPTFNQNTSGTAASLSATLVTSLGGTGLTGFTAANNAIYSTSASALTAGTLPVAAGGTGLTSLTAGYIPYASSSSALSFSSGLISDGSNLGLGVTPSAWGLASSGYRAVEVGAAGNGIYAATDEVDFICNAYYNGGWKYGAAASTKATKYYQGGGIHQWSTAGNGTAGNPIAFTQAMTLDASSNLSVAGSITSTISGKSAAFNAAGGSIYASFADGTKTWRIGSGIQSAGLFSLYNATDAITAFNVDSSGNVGIGTSSPGFPLDVVSNSSANAFKIRARSGNDYGFMQFSSNDGATRWAEIYATSTSALAFTTGSSGTERARIDSSGTFRVKGAGTAGSSDAFQVSGSAPANAAQLDSSGNMYVGTTSVYNSFARLTSVTAIASNAAGVFATQVASDVGQPAVLIGKYDNVSTTSQIFVRFLINNSVTANGQINANGANTVAFGSWSDARLKENIVDLPSQLNNILALRPREFDYIESEGGGHQIGFVAQEIQQIYPDAVGEREDGMLTVTAWSKTEARLVKAIQELAAQVEELKAKVA